MSSQQSASQSSFILAFAGKRILPQSIPDMGKLIQTFLDVFVDYTEYDELIMLNGLAEGADALAAEAWLGRPVAAIHLLHAVIPMPEVRYERSLATDADRMRFRRLWEHAHFHTALDATGDTNPNAPYIAQSDYLVEHGQQLLAVADTSAERKEGGTLDTIFKFMDAGKAVACYDYEKGGWMSFRPGRKDHLATELKNQLIFYNNLNEY